MENQDVDVPEEPVQNPYIVYHKRKYIRKTKDKDELRQINLAALAKGRDTLNKKLKTHDKLIAENEQLRQENAALQEQIKSGYHRILEKLTTDTFLEKRLQKNDSEAETRTPSAMTAPEQTEQPKQVQHPVKQPVRKNYDPTYSNWL
jgi:uncharacterized phage infection (PIP) family protein YhgE